jgi:hypothetical protein
MPITRGPRKMTSAAIRQAASPPRMPGKTSPRFDPHDQRRDEAADQAFPQDIH